MRLIVSCTTVVQPCTEPLLEHIRPATLWLDGYNRERANYVTAALHFSIAKGLSLGYLYKHGHDAPAFKGVTRQALTIGVGFGS